MYWTLAIAIAIMGGILGYTFMWVVSLDMAVKALREDRDVMLRKLSGRIDGATLAEAIDKRGSTEELVKALGQLEESEDDDRYARTANFGKPRLRTDRAL